MVTRISRKWNTSIWKTLNKSSVTLFQNTVKNVLATQVSAQTSFGVTVRVIGEHKDSVLRTLSAALPAFENIATMMGIPLPLNKVSFFPYSIYSN